MDDEWKFGGDDASIAASIRDGRPGTAMAPFKDLISEEQIRVLVFYIRDQAGQLKGKPETKVDPQGAVLKTEKQTVKLDIVAKDLETPWGLAFLPDGRLLDYRATGPAPHPRQGQAPAPGDRYAHGVGASGRRVVRRRSASAVRPERMDLPVVFGNASRLQSARAGSRGSGRSPSGRTRRATEPAVDDRHRARQD